MEIKKDDFYFVPQNQFESVEKYQDSSPFKDIVKRFFKNKGACLGLFLIILIIIMALVGPLLNEHTYKSAIIEHASLPPKISAIKDIPLIGSLFNGQINGVDIYANKNVTVDYWFGTDSLGRDIFTRVWTGTRVSLFIAFVAVIVDIFIGMIYGLISGYFGGVVDMVLQRLAEILNGIPTLVLVTLLTIVMPPGITSIIVALMITGWLGMSRIARAQTLKLKNQEYILASKTLGASHFHIIFKDILPNIFGHLIVMSMFSIPSAIFMEAYLSFIGLGVPAPMASLGSLISDGYKAVMLYPHMILSSIIVLALLMLGFNLFADGLRDALDPTQKQK